jgi:hypothetical protein
LASSFPTVVGDAGLAVRAREHGQGGVGVRHVAQRGRQPVQRGQQHLVAGLPKHQRIAEVVDVLGGAGEVHEFKRRRQALVVLQPLLDEVLDRLDVVVGGPLDLLDPRRVGSAEALGHRPQAGRGGFRQGSEFDDARLGRQGQQPLDLDPDPGPDQSEFREDRTQRRDLAGVAAIERGQCEQGLFGHRSGSGQDGNSTRGYDRCPSCMERAMAGKTRLEHDSFGELRVPASALYGAQTQRAVQNFPISGCECRGLSCARSAWSRRRRRRPTPAGLLPRTWPPPSAPAQRVADGELDAEFPIDVFQTGSGTSSNMNANEVIATLASRALGSRSSQRPRQSRAELQRVIPTTIQAAAALDGTTSCARHCAPEGGHRPARKGLAKWSRPGERT